MDRRIPVLLLTGYLGSGKTTLVNNILSNRKGIKFAVIVNDIGEVNIDESLISREGIVNKKDDSLVALQNGCICCTLKMDLVEQLKGLVDSGKFDYIVIEASGICEPEPIARTVCSIKDIVGDFPGVDLPVLDCIVTVVDALRMRDEFSCAKDLMRGNIAEDDIENLVIQQVEFCNIILLNKASEVSPTELGLVREIIRKIQPKARIIECDWARTDLDNLLDTGLFDYESVSSSATWISEVEKGANVSHEEDHEDDHEEDHGHHHHDLHDEDHGHHHHHHDDEPEGESEEYGIGTFVYFSRRPFDMNKFDSFVAKHWPTGIIRVKGICYFEEEYDRCFLFEQAGSQISLKDCGAWFATMPEDEIQQQLVSDPTLARDWDPEYGDRMQKLVFIGRNMDRAAIKSALDFCLKD